MMSMDIGSQESTEPTTEISESTEVTYTEDHSTEAAETPSHPFWGEVEEKVGPNVWETIKPILAKSDTEARNKITALNKQYEPWKQFETQGLAPDQVSQAIEVVKHLNENPEQVYLHIQEFLKKNGRLPSQEELVQEVVDSEEEDEIDPRDAQIQELRSNQEKMAEFFERQYQQNLQAQINQEADSWAEAEWSRVMAAKPDFQKEDWADVGKILMAQTNKGEEPNLDNAVAQYEAMRDRIRSAPRAGASAPRVPGGTSGGNPASGALTTEGMSRDQRRELVAQMLSGNKA